MEIKKRGRTIIIGRYARLVMLFCTSTLYAQQILQPVIENRHPIVGESINIRVLLPSIDTATVRWQLPVLPNGIVYAQTPVLRGNSILNLFQSNQTGTSEFLISVVSRKSTRYVFPEFQITDSENQYTIAPFVLEVYENERDTTVPSIIQWAGKQKLYTGESSLYVLYVMHSDAFVFPESISFGSSRSGTIDEVFGAGTVISDEIDGMELFTIPIVAVLFTPAQQGNNFLPQVEVKLNGETIRSEAFSITVDALPLQLQVNAAIGDMTFSHALSKREVALGESVVLTLRISGSGNIPFVSLPTPSVEGLIETNREEVNEYTPQPEGFVGYREVNITYDALEAGDYRIGIPEFSNLDSSGIIQNGAASNYTLNVAADSNTAKNSPISMLSSDTILENEPSHYYREAILYLLFLPGLIILLIAIIRVLRKAKSGIVLMVLTVALLVSATPDFSQIDSAVEAYNQGNYQKAADAFSKLIAEYPDISRLHYNLALCYIALEKVPESIFELRKAIALNPHYEIYRTTLEETEDAYQLHQQMPASEYWDPDIFFIALVVIWNASCIIGSILLLRKQHAELVLFGAVTVITCVIGAVLLFRSVIISERDIAIVAVAESIKRIPEANTQPWFMLDQGLTVAVNGKYGKFYRITTATGVAGWIEETALLYTGTYSD